MAAVPMRVGDCCCCEGGPGGLSRVGFGGREGCGPGGYGWGSSGYCNPG